MQGSQRGHLQQHPWRKALSRRSWFESVLPYLPEGRTGWGLDEAEGLDEDWIKGLDEDWIHEISSAATGLDGYWMGTG